MQASERGRIALRLSILSSSCLLGTTSLLPKSILIDVPRSIQGLVTLRNCCTLMVHLAPKSPLLDSFPHAVVANGALHIAPQCRITFPKVFSPQASSKGAFCLSRFL